MRKWTEITNIKMLGKNFKSFTIVGEEKTVEVKNLGDIKGFLNYYNLSNFIEQEKVYDDFLYKANLKLILNGEKDDVDEVGFYLIARDSKNDTFLTKELYDNMGYGWYYFDIFPYTEEFGIGQESLGRIEMKQSDGILEIKLPYYNQDNAFYKIIDYIYDMYQIN